MTTAIDWLDPNCWPSQCMKVMMEVMMITTQKIEQSEVIKFLVTSIRMMKENVIAMAIPWKALVTKALSTAIDVQAPQVYFIFARVGALPLTSSFKVSM